MKRYKQRQEQLKVQRNFYESHRWIGSLCHCKNLRKLTQTNHRFIDIYFSTTLLYAAVTIKILMHHKKFTILIKRENLFL